MSRETRLGLILVAGWLVAGLVLLSPWLRETDLALRIFPVLAP